jgi:hypothetical protein
MAYVSDTMRDDPVARRDFFTVLLLAAQVN